MNTHLLNLLLLFSFFFFSISLSIFAHPFNNFPNLPNNLPNITFPTSWDSFKNFSGCHIGDKVDGLAQIKKYFHQFGYLSNQVDNFTDDFDDLLESALKTYQLNFNLNDTGVLDDTTLQQITLPRCGNADVVNGSSTMKSGSRTRNTDSSSTLNSVAHYSFFPSQPRWPSRKRDLTYAFAPENQLTDTVKSVFARAFLRWQDVTPLTFRETQYYDTADITIGFFGGSHGDGEPFDGILGTLAHAFSPPDGRLHLDDAENWVIENDVSTSSSNAAIDLESVAVHEIGHLLGLGHSSVPEAIMYPTISTGLKKVDLASDDVEGIQVLYGGNPNGSGYTGSTSSQERERDSSDGVVQYVGSFKLTLGLVIIIGAVNNIFDTHFFPYMM